MANTPPPVPAAASPSRRRFSRPLLFGAAIVVVVAGICLAAFWPFHNTRPVTTANGTPTADGCPSSAAPPNWSSPSIILTEQNVSSVSALKTGDTVEFHLPTGYRWNLQSASSNFQLLTPAGYEDPSLQACVWRFSAHSLGAGAINFTRQQLCQRGRICSPIIIEFRYGFAIG